MVNDHDVILPFVVEMRYQHALRSGLECLEISELRSICLGAWIRLAGMNHVNYFASVEHVVECSYLIVDVTHTVPYLCLVAIYINRCRQIIF